MMSCYRLLMSLLQGKQYMYSIRPSHVASTVQLKASMAKGPKFLYEQAYQYPIASGKDKDHKLPATLVACQGVQGLGHPILRSRRCLQGARWAEEYHFWSLARSLLEEWMPYSIDHSPRKQKVKGSDTRTKTKAELARKRNGESLQETPTIRRKTRP